MATGMTASRAASAIFLGGFAALLSLGAHAREPAVPAAQPRSPATAPRSADSTLDCKGDTVLTEINNKYDKIIFRNGCRILFDQQAIDQRVDKKNQAAVQLFASVWEFPEPRTGRYLIGYAPVTLDGRQGEAGPG